MVVGVVGALAKGRLAFPSARWTLLFLLAFLVDGAVLGKVTLLVSLVLAVLVRRLKLTVAFFKNLWELFCIVFAGMKDDTLRGLYSCGWACVLRPPNHADGGRGDSNFSITFRRNTSRSRSSMKGGFCRVRNRRRTACRIEEASNADVPFC